MKSILTALILFFACSVSAQEEIRIGAILPLSGDAQEFGKEARLALEHALSDVPTQKFRYKLLFEDDQLSSAKASSAAQKLVEVDGVKVVFSNWSYGGNAVASVVRNKPVINLAFAWDSGVLKVGSNTFQTAAPTDNLTNIILSKIKAEKSKSISLLGFQEAGVVQAFNDTEVNAKNLGIEVLSRVEIDPSDTASIRSLLLRLRKLKPDYLVTCLIHPQYQELFRQLNLLQLNIPVASIGQAPFDPGFKAFLPKTWWSADYKANLEDEEKIRQRTGLQDLSGYPAYYEALRMVITSYESADTTDIPSSDWLQKKLSTYSTNNSLLGKIHIENQRIHSDNAMIINQVARY